MSEGGLPPAGWYPDPAGSELLRWWDGRGWRVETTPRAGRDWRVETAPRDPWAAWGEHPATSGDRPATSGDRPGTWRDEPGLSGGASYRQGLWASERQMARWARWYVVVYPLVSIGGYLYLWSLVPAYRRWWHLVRAQSGEFGTPGYKFPQPPSLYGGGGGGGYHRLLGLAYGLGELGILVLFVFFLIWQYRAALLARSLGYPAKRSPGFGVGAWFIPVVSIWMPYQAIRDTLPPNHPSRAWLWRVWVLVVAAVIVGPVGIVLLVAREPAGVGFLAVAALFVFLAAWLAHGVIDAIDADHAAAARL
jgi:hypothetical protein